MSDLIRQSRVIDSLVKQGNDNQLKKQPLPKAEATSFFMENSDFLCYIQNRRRNMTLVIKNADNKLVEMIDAINKMSKKVYSYVKEDEYPAELVESIKAGEKEYNAAVKDGTLKTYATAQEAFADL